MNRKRILSLMMAFCMVLSLLPADVLAVELPARGSDVPQLVDGYYEIYNADQLYWFAEQVSGGSTSINGKLMADIVVNENVLKAGGAPNSGSFRTWTPIGNYDNQYTGTFDGNGKTISGLYLSSSPNVYVGLFGCIGYMGTVKQLELKDSCFSGNQYVGTIAGMIAANATITNCVTTSYCYGIDDTGGVVGMNYGDITNCRSGGYVRTVGSYSKEIGGVVGDNNGTITDCYFDGTLFGKPYVDHCSRDSVYGGVAARNSGTITGCYNIGEVIGGPGYIGGIVGYNTGLVYKCYNTEGFYALVAAGGIVGNNNGGTIKSCYNSGRVSGFLHGSDPRSGGIAGYGGTLIDCYNIGEVDGELDFYDAIIGDCSDSVVRCFYMVGCCDEGSYLGTAMTAEQFASGEVAYLLGEDFGQTIGTDTYPVLGGAAVYKNRVGGCNESSYTYGYSNTQADAVTSHDWSAATCTKPRTCADCGLTEGNALGHNWAQATCTKPSTCTTCGATTGNALGHQWEDATCSTAKTCTQCGSTSGNPLGHRWAAATCTEPKTCTVCGATTGTALGHSWKAATCTSPKTCIRCGLTEGNPLGHTWAAATCTEPQTCIVCGASDGDPNGHTWADATCTDPQTCTVCGATDGEPNGHSWTEATCTEPKTCTRCGLTEGNAWGHNWADATGTEPYICTICGITTDVRYIEFTVDTLGLLENSYSTGTATIGGVDVEWVQLGNYGDGIMMRDKNGKTSMLRNTIPMLGGITKIELTYSDTKDVLYSNENAVIFSFGDEAKGAMYSTKLSTIAGTKTYTITPNVNTYTYFSMEHDLGYTFYWKSIKVYYEGYYEIYNADHLYWFAEQVNSGNTSINGKLMADIVVNENVLNADGTLAYGSFLSWTPIGSQQHRYSGIFDGNGKTISGLYFSNTSVDYVGLFGYTYRTAQIKNLGLVDSYFKGRNYVGGIVGYNYGDVSKCYNECTIHGVKYVGGLAAVCDGDVNYENYHKDPGTVTYCYNAGKIYGDTYVGGLVGCVEYRFGNLICGGTLMNSYHIGQVSGVSYVGSVAGEGSDVHNCYYLVETPLAGVTQALTAEQFASGQAAYDMGEGFGQTIGVDPFPVFDGQTVYRNQTGGCGGSNTTYVYSNTAADPVVIHDMVDATCLTAKYCSVCGITEGEPLGHNYVITVVEPTCTDNGYQRHQCANCWDVYYTNEVGAKGHRWTEATCTAPKTCTTCGATEGTVEPHSFGDTVVHDPAPGVQGYSEHTCTICGFNEKFDFVDFPGVRVSGTVISYLDGDVTVQLLQGGEVVYSVTTGDGSYAIEGVATGDYILRISQPNHGAKEMVITVGDQPLIQDATICPEGDVTGDGVVNIKDFQRLLRHVNKTDSLIDYALACGDVTGDGVVNVKDFARLLRHVNKTDPLF